MSNAGPRVEMPDPNLMPQNREQGNAKWHDTSSQLPPVRDENGEELDTDGELNRETMVKLAAQLPKGSPERREILAHLCCRCSPGRIKSRK